MYSFRSPVSVCFPASQTALRHRSPCPPGAKSVRSGVGSLSGDLLLSVNREEICVTVAFGHISQKCFFPPFFFLFFLHLN